MTAILLKERHVKSHRGTQENAKMAVMLPQAKDLLEAGKLAWNRSTPRAFRGSMAPWILWSQTSGLWSGETVHCWVFSATSFAVLYYGSSRKLIHILSQMVYTHAYVYVYVYVYILQKWQWRQVHYFLKLAQMVANYMPCLLLTLLSARPHPPLIIQLVGMSISLYKEVSFFSSTFLSLDVQYIDITSITLMGISVISVLFLSQDMLQ